MDKNDGKVNAGGGRQADDGKSLPIFVKYGIIALAIIVVIAIGLVIYFNIAGSYVATVDGEKIGVGEFKYYLELEKQNMYTSALNVDPNLKEETFWNTKIGGEDPVEVAKKKVIDNMQVLKIQLLKAKESKISLTSEELKTIDDGIKTQIIDTMGSGNKIQANKQLQNEYGFTLDDLRKVQIESYTVQKYQSGEISKIKITDEDIKKSYDADPKSFDKVTVRHILFLFTGKDGKRTKEDSKKLADDTLAKIKAGDDMAALAEKLSEDPGVTENKGEYSVTKFDSYVPAFLDWAMKANVGDAAVVESADTQGYHVMKAEKRESQAFDAVKEQIRSQLVQEQFGKQYTAQVDGWKKDPKYNPKLTSVYDSIKIKLSNK